MKALASLQQQLQGAVLAQSAGTAAPALLAREQADSAGGGFQLYVNAYRIRLAAALRDNYPVLHLALGDEMFDALATAYIAQHPSRFRSIRWFGGKLVEFMQSHAALTPHPALCDLAKMDWALRQAFDAADDLPLTVDDLAALAPEAWPGQRFRLRAATAIVKLGWRVGPLWQTLNQNPGADTEAPEPLDHALIVWRNGLDCHWRSLDAAESIGLQALADGSAFTDICERMMTANAEMTPTAAAIALRRWVEQGLLAPVPPDDE